MTHEFLADGDNGSAYPTGVVPLYVCLWRWYIMGMQRCEVVTARLALKLKFWSYGHSFGLSFGPSLLTFASISASNFFLPHPRLWGQTLSSASSTESEPNFCP